MANAIETIDYSAWTLKDFKKNLTLKQQIFCRSYVSDKHGTKAAEEAGYSKKTAYAIASENLNKPEIVAFMNYLMKNIEEATGVTKIKVLKEYCKLAFSSIADLHNTWISRKEFDELTPDQKACIQEIDSKVIKKPAKAVYDSDGNLTNPGEMKYTAFVKVKLYSKTKALDGIRELMGYDAPTQISATIESETFADLIKKAHENNQK